MKTRISLAWCLWMTATVLWLVSRSSFAQDCEPTAAKIISVQGQVEVGPSGTRHWKTAQLNQVLCAGQQVRLMAKSRAVLQLPNETLIHLDEGSVFTLRAIEPDKPAWLDLLRGALHIISRVPRALNIRTPLVNAGIEGTEFALQVQKEEAALWVYEGRVRFSNTLGQLLIASGEAAAAAPGRAPERRIVIKPRRAVEWALYYPPLLDTRPDRYPEALRPAVLAYRRNDFTAAFAALDGVPEGARDARYHTLRAGLLLSVGRVPEAEGDLTSAQRLDPKNGTAYALRSVIAVARNEQEEALKLAAEAVRLAPGSATPYVARSYAEQSAFEIETARESLQKAAKLAPEDALVWARLAEIELSLGDLDAALEAARKAERLDPGLSRTQNVLGFAYLTRIEIDEARAAFERAMALDPADPLPHLGLGLAKIRDGDLDNGTKEIEIAAALDPNNSLVRSYLGKAYYEQKRDGLASSEYEQAKLLDPKDPTPWFYDAIRKQTTNRPVEALHDLQRSIDLNDNRAVYRSRLLLDEDLAARGAALGRIYDELGFEQLALIEGWKSTNADPTNYSAHRLLSDSYRALPRHEIARVSELLQSQLLQPINITPVQPQLAERDLLFLGNSGPSDPSLNEFNSLFLRNRLALQASGLVGDNNTLGDEVVQSGVVRRHSYSLGQFHYDTDGFRDNNDYQQDIYNVFLQSTLSHNSSAQIELRHTDIDEGDRGLRFFLSDDFRPKLRQEREINTARLGAHYSYKQGYDLLFSAIVADIDARQNNTDPNNPSRIAYDATAYLFEAQHLFRSSAIDVIAGAGYFTTTGRHQLITSPLVPFPLFDQTDDISRANAYVYSYVHVLPILTMTLGLTTDFFDGALVERNLVNPNIGLTWEPVTGTTVRIAAFGGLSKEGLDISETIEPTHVAGFNKFFGEPVAADSDAINRQGVEEWRYGIGVDQKVSSNLYAGVEVSSTELDVPGAQVIFGSPPERLDEEWHETSGRAYLYWTPHPWFATTVQYFYENIDRGKRIGPFTGILDLESHRVPLEVGFFHPSGISAKLAATYIAQEGDLVTRGPPLEIRPGEDNFWVIDAALQYRLPKRSGFITIGINNLLDDSFHFQPTDFNTPVLARDRQGFIRLTLSY